MEKSQSENVMDKKRRVIAVLGWLANINSFMRADTEAELHAHFRNCLKDALQDPVLVGFLGTWKLAWGPGLANTIKFDFKTNRWKWITLNAMYIVSGENPNKPAGTSQLYVAAVSATNPISIFDVAMEDAAVHRLDPWNPGDPAMGKVSHGSAVGLAKLLGMTDEKTGRGLVDFYRGLSAQSAELAICGHSLAGALVPLVALRLREQGKEAGMFQPIVSAYPSGGATPGDAAFAQYASKALQGNYFSTVNKYDVVPHAWADGPQVPGGVAAEAASFVLGKLPELYSTSRFNGGQGIKMPAVLCALIDGLRGLVRGKNYARILGDDEYQFEGDPFSHSSADTSDGYQTEAAWQHVAVYNHANAFDLPEEVVTCLKKYVGQKTPSQKAQELTVAKSVAEASEASTLYQFAL